MYDYEGDNVDGAKEMANYYDYGILYNWQAAIISCPEGWHLASDAEWLQLIEFVGENAAFKMRSATGWYQNHNGDNSSGFNAYPGGYCEYRGNGFYSLSKQVNFWTTDSSKEDTTKAFSRSLTHDGDPHVQSTYSSKVQGYSARCIKD